MRRFVKLFAVAVLAAAAGALSLLPGQGQVGQVGLPPGVILKNPAESALSITVLMGQGVYIEKATAAEFIRFKLNQSAFVYLYEIAPNGEVRLLFPNRAEANNFLAAGEYAFPEDFMLGFPIGQEGVYTVQAIATLMPVELTPGAELFRLLGTDPEAVRRGVELLIAQSRLIAAQWAADWTQYRVLKTMRTAGGYGQVVIQVMDLKKAMIIDALVKIEQIDEQGNVVKVVLDWRTVGTELSWNLESGVKYRLLARRPILYTPDPQIECTVRKGELEVSLPSCVLELVPRDYLRVTFTLKPHPDTVDFKVIRPEMPNPYCVGRRVEFEAFVSRPKEQILHYLWNFGDGTTKLETEPTTSHIFRHRGVYLVTLTVVYQGNVTKPVSKSIKIVDSEHPGCPPSPGPETFGKAECTLLPPNTIDCKVRNGYAIVPVPGLSLPPGSAAIRFSFQYLITAFPVLDVQQLKAFAISYVGLAFVDAAGKILGIPIILYAIEPNKLPPMLQPQSITVSLEVPKGAKGLMVFAVTSVLATAEATEDPVNIRYSGFRVEPSPLPLPCVKLAIGQLVGGQFVEKQVFRLGEQIEFRFTNNCPQAIALRSDAGWWRIVDTQTGREIFRTAPTTVSVPPNQSLQWTWIPQWPQVEFNRIYYIEVEVQAGAVYSAPFAIVFP